MNYPAESAPNRETGVLSVGNGQHTELTSEQARYTDDGTALVTIHSLRQILKLYEGQDVPPDTCLRIPAAPNQVHSAGQPLILCNQMLVIDPADAGVEFLGRIIRLRPREYELLTALGEQPDIPMSRQELLERVWGSAHFIENAVTVAVGRVRSAVGFPGVIGTATAKQPNGYRHCAGYYVPA